ncbi:metal-dependent hydrolase [Candidatus Campbellbacteria bacterium]|nr:MAG: metal-dependent hydrolase [Candidatus Campbellbacteria bacterium]
MKKSVILDNQEVFYTEEKSSRLKNIKIVFKSQNELQIKRPKKLLFFNAQKFILKNKTLILKKLQKLKQQNLQKVSLSQKEFQKRKDDFLKKAEEKVEYFNSFYNFKYNKITIKNQKTKWGSCSSKGNLNFNYRIFLLDQKILNYVIVHELCHLDQMNHSKKFWNLVEQTIPDYKETKKLMQKYIF